MVLFLPNIKKKCIHKKIVLLQDLQNKKVFPTRFVSQTNLSYCIVFFFSEELPKKICTIFLSLFLLFPCGVFSIPNNCLFFLPSWYSSSHITVFPSNHIYRSNFSFLFSITKIYIVCKLHYNQIYHIIFFCLSLYNS